jgi:glycosyltransferase involved in cell wall biosynthesis
MASRIIRMLYFVREPFPTYRPDVEVLFGEELLQRGHRIDLVMQAGRADDLLGPRPWHDRTVWVGGTDLGAGLLHRLRKHCRAVQHDFRSLRLARAESYDAVQVRDKFLIAAVAVFVARRRGLKFFYWLSFPEPESQLARVRERTARYPALTYIRGVTFGWLLYRWILPRCDHAFVQSEQMRRDIALHRIDPEKLTAVPMGVAASEVAAPRAPAETEDLSSSSALTIAYLGTLNSQRRLEVLIDMLEILLRGAANVRLLIVGDGDAPEDRLRLERRADELGVRDHLEITGFIPRAQALERVRSAAICLSPFFPSPILRSTSPTKLVEYLGLGIPVVANDHPEQRYILKESGAGVCVPWGARFFAKGVTWLAARSALDRRRMGECGRSWVLENRTYKRIADRLEDEYSRLLSVSKH